MNQLIQRIKQTTFIDSSLEAAIEEFFFLEQFPKNAYLVEEGQCPKELFFLTTGVVRTFYIHKDKEVTSWIYRPEQFFTAWYGFLNQSASYEYIEVISDASLYSISYTNLQKLYKEHPSFERFGRLLIEEQMAFLDYFYKGYSFLTAKERYQSLLEYYPDIELHVKLGYIASLLGISQETLSRIRAK